MNALEEARRLKGDKFEDFARKLVDDGKEINTVLVGLLRDDGDYEKVAELVSCCLLNGSLAYNACGENYYAASDLSETDRHIKALAALCRDAGIGEEEYISVLFAALYAKNGVLYTWREAADKYLRIQGENDYEFVADSIDKCDKGFKGYASLMAVDTARTVNRLLAKLLNEKNIDKAAIRDVLMECPRITDALISVYNEGDIKTRAEIARLLKVYKSNKKAKVFLENVVANDKSKTVRDVLGPKSYRATKNGVKIFEGLMMSGKPISVARFRYLIDIDKVRDVAEKLFFYYMVNGEKIVLTLDGGDFFDLNDKKAELKGDEKLYVLHPIDTPAYAREILDYYITQPFLQIKRPVFKRESGASKFSDKLCGTMLDRNVFMKNMRAIGFVFITKKRKDEPDVVLYAAGNYAVSVVCDLPKSAETAGCGKISFHRISDIVKIKRSVYIDEREPLFIHEIPDREYSELIYAVYRLFGYASQE